MSLWPYQLDGVELCLSPLVDKSRPPARLLLDQQGTGKTVQFAAAAGLRPHRPVVVACPAGLRRHWRRDLRRFGYRDALVVESAAGAEIAAARLIEGPEEDRTLVLSHDNLVDALRSPRGAPWLRMLLRSGAMVNLDEAHRFKSATSQRGRASKEVRELVHAGDGMTLWSTATPMPRDPLDLWVLLTWAGLSKATFGDVFKFAKHFGGKTLDGGRSWYWSPHVPGGPVMQLAGYALRRLRSEVLPEMPAKRYKVLQVEAEGAARQILDKVGRAAAAVFGRTVEEIDPEREPQVAAGLAQEIGRRLEEMSEARVEIARAKIPALMRRIAELEEQGELVAVYSDHLAPIEALRGDPKNGIAGRPGWVFIVGDESDNQRTEAAAAFDSGDAHGIAFTAAGREGFNLRRATWVLIVSAPWNHDDQEQAEDRAARFGRVADLTIETIVISHPVELLVQRGLARKRQRRIEALDAGATEGGFFTVLADDTPQLEWLSWTRLSYARDCKFAADMRYRLKVRPAQHPEERRMGVLFDEAISARLPFWAADPKGESCLGPEADAAARAAIREAAKRHAWAQNKGDTETAGEVAFELSRRALVHFGFTSGRFLPYFHNGEAAVQLELRVPLPPPLDQGWAGWYQKTDLIVYDTQHRGGTGHARLTVTDFKCRTFQLGRSLSDGQDDAQLMLYTQGCRKAGIPIECALRLEVRGKLPESPETLKSNPRKLSRDKSLFTNADLYREAIRAHGFNEADYVDHLEWLERSGPRLTNVVQCGRSDAALESVWQDMLFDAWQMMQPGRPVRNLRARASSPCHAEAWPCEYKELCTGTMSGHMTPEAYAQDLVRLGRLRFTGRQEQRSEEEDLEQEVMG